MRAFLIRSIDLCCLSLLLFFSCQEDDEQASLLTNQLVLTETKWNLQFITSEVGGIQLPPKEFQSALYIYFETDTTFQAGSSCNAGFGRYKNDLDGNFHVEVLGSTYKLCADVNMEWEDKFFSAIRESEKYTINGNLLILMGKNKMVFQKEEPS